MERYRAKYDDLDLLDALAEPRHKIGDIAFVKEEAEKGKTIPVMVVGIDYDVAIDECRCYDEDELISEEEADKLVTAYVAHLMERISTLKHLSEATKRALAWPDPEMPVTVEDGHVKFLAVNRETGF